MKNNCFKHFMFLAAVPFILTACDSDNGTSSHINPLQESAISSEITTSSSSPVADSAGITDSSASVTDSSVFPSYFPLQSLTCFDESAFCGMYVDPDDPTTFTLDFYIKNINSIKNNHTDMHGNECTPWWNYDHIYCAEAPMSDAPYVYPDEMNIWNNGGIYMSVSSTDRTDTTSTGTIWTSVIGTDSLCDWISGDISDWGGICFAYATSKDISAYLTTKNEDPAKLDLDSYPHVILPPAPDGAKVCFSWDEFENAGTGDSSLTALEISKKAYTLSFRIQSYILLRSVASYWQVMGN